MILAKERCGTSLPDWSHRGVPPLRSHSWAKASGFVRSKGWKEALIVRIAGYCAYFVDLTPAQQAEIIARTEEAV